MVDFMRGSIQGFVKIIDKDTKEVLVDAHNDVLYGNMSVALSQALIGNPNNLLYYMAFGNGGAYVGSTGTISYKPSIGGQASLNKNPTANLYNTIYVKKISNNATGAYDITQSAAYIPITDVSTNYEDIIIDVTLEYSEPSSNISQSQIDNSSFVGNPSDTAYIASTANTLVFNEIGLFAGSGGNTLFNGPATTSTGDVSRFVNQTATSSGATSKLMLTHVVFHPIQKSANRSLEIIYTLRIQMGTPL